MMKIIRHFFAFAVLTSILVACDSVGTYQGPQQQLDDVQVFRNNLQGLAFNYKLNKDKVGTLCSDSISKYIKVRDRKINLNVIDISMLSQFDKENQNPVFYMTKSPNLFHFCANANSRNQTSFLAFSYFNPTDTIWETIKDKNAALKDWLPKLSNWSDKFDEENVAIFYTTPENSKYPKLDGEMYEAGTLSGLLILVNWDKITPICSIPCFANNSDQIDFTYLVGSENWAAMDKLKDDLVVNLGNQLVQKFKDLGINQVDSVKIYY